MVIFCIDNLIKITSLVHMHELFKIVDWTKTCNSFRQINVMKTTAITIDTVFDILYYM